MNAYKLENITKTFVLGKTTVTALAGIDLVIPAGETIALQGASGSGKSTLLNVLGLIERPTTGSIILAGETLRSQADGYLTRLRRRDIGFIFQNFNLMPMLTAHENIEYALHLERRYDSTESRKRVAAILDATGLSAVAAHKPAQLSGGQRQRVAIARALVKEPKVILGDEPTANLDSTTAEQIIDLIIDLNRRFGTTIILATHDRDVAAKLRHRIEIKDGKIVGSSVS